MNWFEVSQCMFTAEHSDALCVCRVYVVSVGAELPEGLDEEPGAFVPRPVQSDPHGVLLQQSGEALVHRQVFITLHVEQLQTQNVLS